MDRWALVGGQGGERASVDLPGSSQVLIKLSFMGHHD